MTSSASRPAVLVLGVLLASLLGGCGFNDTLTSRGFIKEGDQICIDTLVKARIALHSRPGVTGSEFLSTLGSAYGAAAGRFRRLKIRSDDEAMRDRIVSGYSSFSTRFRAASRSSDLSLALPIFTDVSGLQRGMKDYGFQVCGGGGANTS
jgi:hypothetical protein